MAQEGKSDGSSKKKFSNEVTPDLMPSESDNNLASSTSAENQKAIDEIKAQLAKMATKQLVALIEFCKKNDIAGEFVVDLTVEAKGRVVTVLMVSTPEISIPKKNMLKDKLSELQFDNIKLPKKQRAKYRYTLNF